MWIQFVFTDLSFVSDLSIITVPPPYTWTIVPYKWTSYVYCLSMLQDFMHSYLCLLHYSFYIIHSTWHDVLFFLNLAKILNIFLSTVQIFPFVCTQKNETPLSQSVLFKENVSHCTVNGSSLTCTFAVGYAIISQETEIITHTSFFISVPWTVHSKLLMHFQQFLF